MAVEPALPAASVGGRDERHVGAEAGILLEVRRRQRRRWLWTVSAVAFLATAAFLILADEQGGASRSTCEMRWTANANDASFDLEDRGRYIDDCMKSGKQVDDFR